MSGGRACLERCDTALLQGDAGPEDLVLQPQQVRPLLADDGGEAPSNRILAAACRHPRIKGTSGHARLRAL